MKRLLIKLLIIALAVISVAACGPAQAPAVGPTAIPPTQAPTNAPATDPASVVKAVHDAMNVQNLDAAMAFIADDAVFKHAPPSGATLTGKAAIRVWVKRQVDTKTLAEIGDVKVNGDTVTFTAKVTRGGAPLASAHGEITVKNSKIILWDFAPAP
jgi:hypothetical protein